jgi:hypothetical protein
MITGQQRKQAARREEKEGSPKFQPVDLANKSWVPAGMTRCFRNNRFTVMIYDNTQTTKGPATRALIQSHYNRPIDNHWSTLQKIKNEVFGPETTAIEYYPAESNLQDFHNIYWLWIFPEGVLPIFENLKNG